MWFDQTKATEFVLVDREAAIAQLGVSKVEEMEIGNHRTAYNALHALPEPHAANLRRMGYGASFCILKAIDKNI